MTVKKFRRRRPKRPFGMLFALLGGCLVTLIGIFTGHEPFTIFCRALVSATVIGLTVSMGASVIKIANIPSETKASQ